ncbi:glycosyltransferase [Cryptosporangium sp. NPDC048952]|uniref:glycosyltransferase n=1 Tax=Cryptosporangium sp. NPDC048952 TaxID=3363961 RepID=UPI00371EEA66
MRVLIVTVGSRGDVAPYTGLAVRLREAGHAVTIATHRGHAGLVTGSGAAFRPLPGDQQTVLEAAAISIRAAPGIVRYLDQLGTALLDAARSGVDALLTSAATAPLATQIGAGLGVPVVGLHLQPAHPTRAFAPPVTSIGTLGPGNRPAARFVQSVVDTFSAPAVRRIRRELGLRGRVPDHPVLYGFSPAVLPPPPDWPADARAVGYWWPAPAQWHPPASLVEFLAAGPAPVYVGLGSVGDGRAARRFTELAVRACRRVGARIVLRASAVAVPSGDDLFRVDDVPHERLFPRMAAVVHHGGAGTTAATLRAGVPSVPAPVQADQYLWARRSVALGVAPAALRLRSSSLTSLADVLRAAVAGDAYRERAEALAEILATEDGAEAVVAAVGRLR